jgi:hypothetical protein
MITEQDDTPVVFSASAGTPANRHSRFGGTLGDVGKE